MKDRKGSHKLQKVFKFFWHCITLYFSTTCGWDEKSLYLKYQKNYTIERSISAGNSGVVAANIAQSVMTFPGFQLISAF
jgi:hypothetical protein